MTAGQLEHLRDLFSVSLPPDGSVTISQALGRVKKNRDAEESLWQSVATLCQNANISVAEGAPDFVVSVSGPPSLDVFCIDYEENS